MSVVVERRPWGDGIIWVVYMVNADGATVSLEGWPHYTEAHAMVEAQALADQYGVAVKVA